MKPQKEITAPTEEQRPLDGGQIIPASPVVASQQRQAIAVEVLDDGCDVAEVAAPVSSSSSIQTLCGELRERNRDWCNRMRRTLEDGITSGQLLERAKKNVRHGHWATFLAEAEIGERAAQNYMRLYRNRDDLPSKSALNADLTMTASLKVLQKSTRKPLQTIHAAREVGGERTAGSQIQPSPAATDGPKCSGAAMDLSVGAKSIHPSPCVEDSSEPSLPQQPSIVTSLVGKASAEAFSQHEQQHSGAGAQEEAVAEGVARPVPKFHGGATPSEEPTGFLLAGGTQLPPDQWDDGPIPFKWVQSQNKTLKDNNERLKADAQRSVAGLEVQQMFLIELARTANRVLGTLEHFDEPPMTALNQAVFNLRNYTQTSSPKQ